MRILIKYGELTTKGDNRKLFINKLCDNIKEKVKGYDVSIIKEHSRMYLEFEDKYEDEIVYVLKNTFGIHAFNIVYKVSTDTEEIQNEVLERLNSFSFKTFKVNTKRRDKKFSVSSMDFNRIIAGFILKNKDDIMAEIAKNTEVDIPEELVEEEINHMIKHFEEQVRMQGISLDMFYEMTKSNEEALREQMKEEAEKHVLYRIILEKIIETEKVEVTKEEAEKEADNLAKRYAVSREEFFNMYGDIEMLRYELQMKKVFEMLAKENEQK